MTDQLEAIYHEQMQCFVSQIEYDFVNHVGMVQIEVDSCTDMPGTIAMFQAIDSEVREIQTYSDGLPDTLYQRNGSEWVAHLFTPLHKMSVETVDAWMTAVRLSKERALMASDRRQQQLLGAMITTGRH